MIIQKMLGNRPSWQKLIRIGQLLLLTSLICLLLGIILHQAARGNDWFSWTKTFLHNLPRMDFIAGFCMGFGGVMLGASIVLNISGMIQKRRS